MRCITIMGIAIRFNQTRTTYFKLIRGLWQGNALSSILFIICMEVLSSIINDGIINNGSWKSCNMKLGNIVIMHLTFIDDIVFFSNNSWEGIRGFLLVHAQTPIALNVVVAFLPPLYHCLLLYYLVHHNHPLVEHWHSQTWSLSPISATTPFIIELLCQKWLWNVNDSPQRWELSEQLPLPNESPPTYSERHTTNSTRKETTNNTARCMPLCTDKKHHLMQRRHTTLHK